MIFRGRPSRQSGSSQRVVELDDVAAVVGLVERHPRPRMLVEHPGHHVGVVEAPLQGLAHRLDVVLDAVQDRPQPELGVVQKAEQQLHRAVARPAPETRHAGVQPVGALDRRLHGVGEGELPVVVGVHADFLAGRRGVAPEGGHVVVDLLAVERAEAVHYADDVRLDWATSASASFSSRSGTVDRAIRLRLVS